MHSDHAQHNNPLRPALYPAVVTSETRVNTVKATHHNAESGYGYSLINFADYLPEAQFSVDLYAPMLVRVTRVRCARASSRWF